MTFKKMGGNQSRLGKGQDLFLVYTAGISHRANLFHRLPFPVKANCIYSKMQNIITEKKRENSVRLDFCWGVSFRSTESAHQEWEKSSLRKWKAQDIRSGRLSFLS
jgi:hypothetical protein